MRRGGLGILVFLIVAMVVAFLAMKYLQNPKGIQEQVQQTATQAVQGAVDAANNTVQEAMNDPSVQQSVNELIQNFQNMIPQVGGEG